MGSSVMALIPLILIGECQDTVLDFVRHGLQDEGNAGVVRPILRELVELVDSHEDKTRPAVVNSLMTPSDPNYP